MNNHIKYILATLLFVTSSLFICDGVQADDGKSAKAKQILQAMSDHLKQADSYSFEGEIMSEYLTETDAKARDWRDFTIHVRRPNRVKAKITKDGPMREFWYDGTHLTLLDNRENIYAVTRAPDNIDDTLDFAIDKLAMTAPLADFIFSDLYEGLNAYIDSASYVGREKVRAKLCDVLYFTQEDVDWLIWIEPGDKPLPRRMVIIYKNVPFQPEYRINFKQWHINNNLSDKIFQFEKPVGAQEIDFLISEQTEEMP